MQSDLEDITESETLLNRMEDDIFCNLLIDVLMSALGKNKAFCLKTYFMT